MDALSLRMVAKRRSLAAPGSRSTSRGVRRLHFKLPGVRRSRQRRAGMVSAASAARPQSSRASNRKRTSIFDSTDDDQMVGDDDDNDNRDQSQDVTRTANQSVEYSLRFPATEAADETANTSTALPPRITAKRVFERVEASSKGREVNPTYKRYVQRVARSLYGDAGMRMSTPGRNTLNDFATEMFDLLAEQASVMVRATGRQTLGAWDLQQAVNVVLPPDLARYANDFALRHLRQYQMNARE